MLLPTWTIIGLGL